MTGRERTIREMAFIQETIAKLPKGMSSEELLAAEFPPIVWVIPGFITTGLTIVAGAPKLGKSWLVLGMACALSVGGRVLGDIKVDECDVLFLALEDTERRLKDRLQRMSAPASRQMHFRTTWPRGLEAINYLTAWMLAHPKTRVIFIDTLQKISGVEDANNYRETYNATAELKRVADKYNIAIIVIHHTSKMTAVDFVHSVNGSVGLTGAADTIIIIDRPRGQSDGILRIVGRDVEESEIGIHFDSDIGTWKRLDDVPTVPSMRSNGKKKKPEKDGKSAASGEAPDEH